MGIFNKTNKLELGDYQFITSIPGSDKWEYVKLVGGGWSSDVKFHIKVSSGEEFLLRVSSADERLKKMKEFSALQSINKLDIIFPVPYIFGELYNNNKVYMLLKWVEGKNVEEAIKLYPVDKRYELGKQAGQILFKMHSLPTNMEERAWKEKNLTAIEKRNKIYRNSGVKVSHYDEIYDFVMDNLSLLNNRIMTFHHGDYQGRNIIISSNDQVGVIDFNRVSGGDPYEEFNRMMLFTRRFDADFSKGQIDGYFNGNVPEEFFNVMAFHSAMKLLDEMLIAKDQIFEDYSGFTTVVPKWYR